MFPLGGLGVYFIQHRDTAVDLAADLILDEDLERSARASPEKGGSAPSGSKFAELSQNTATILAAFKVICSCEPHLCTSGPARRFVAWLCTLHAGLSFVPSKLLVAS